tara:strand:- start:361 stop:735 length:375 start_codon:yes stop_codon:yes gene_type:complete
MKHNRLDEIPSGKHGPGLSKGHVNIKSSKKASEIANSLVYAFAKALEDKEMNPIELMQCLAEFFVTTVKTIERADIPMEFREILMRNIELNFDHRDALDKGIDISDLLIMGLEDDSGSPEESDI